MPNKMSRISFRIQAVPIISVEVLKQSKTSARDRPETTYRNSKISVRSMECSLNLRSVKSLRRLQIRSRHCRRKIASWNRIGKSILWSIKNISICSTIISKSISKPINSKRCHEYSKVSFFHS